MSGMLRHPLSPNILISEEATTNIARVHATTSSLNFFQLYLDTTWNQERFTRGSDLSRWRIKKPSRATLVPEFVPVNDLELDNEAMDESRSVREATEATREPFTSYVNL